MTCSIQICEVQTFNTEKLQNDFGMCMTIFNHYEVNCIGKFVDPFVTLTILSRPQARILC